MGLKIFCKPFIPCLDYVGLKDEATGEVILEADTFNYLWPLPNGFYLTRKFCFYGIGKVIGKGNNKKFIEVIPSEFELIRPVNLSSFKPCPKYVFEAQKSGKLITYNENGEVLLAA